MRQPGSAVVRVFDLAGRAVRTLIDTHHDAGEYDTFWDGCNDEGERVAGGIYFVRLEAGGISESCKLVLLR
jgi:flagellar hook assembly protein FlgD